MFTKDFYTYLDILLKCHISLKLTIVFYSPGFECPRRFKANMQTAQPKCGLKGGSVIFKPLRKGIQLEHNSKLFPNLRISEQR